MIPTSPGETFVWCEDGFHVRPRNAAAGMTLARGCSCALLTCGIVTADVGNPLDDPKQLRAASAEQHRIARESWAQIYRQCVNCHERDRRRVPPWALQTAHMAPRVSEVTVDIGTSLSDSVAGRGREAVSAKLRRHGSLLRSRRLFFVEPGFDLAYRRFAQQDDIAFG